MTADGHHAPDELHAHLPPNHRLLLPFSSYSPLISFFCTLYSTILYCTPLNGHILFVICVVPTWQHTRASGHSILVCTTSFRSFLARSLFIYTHEIVVLIICTVDFSRLHIGIFWSLSRASWNGRWGFHETNSCGPLQWSRWFLLFRCREALQSQIHWFGECHRV